MTRSYNPFITWLLFFGRGNYFEKECYRYYKTHTNTLKNNHNIQQDTWTLHEN